MAAVISSNLPDALIRSVDLNPLNQPNFSPRLAPLEFGGQGKSPRIRAKTFKSSPSNLTVCDSLLNLALA